MGDLCTGRSARSSGSPRRVDFGNGSPPGRLAGQHFQDGQLEGDLPPIGRVYVCSSHAVDQGQERIVNNMAPLSSTILANPKRRRPGI